MAHFQPQSSSFVPLLKSIGKESIVLLSPTNPSCEWFWLSPFIHFAGRWLSDRVGTRTSVDSSIRQSDAVCLPDSLESDTA